MSGESGVDRCALITDSLASIDRTLLTLAKRSPSTSVRLADDIQYLEQVSDELFEVANVGADLEAYARSLWTEFGNQTGFALAGRAMYRKARASDKGADYVAAYDYCQARISEVQALGTAVAVNLFEVAVTIYYHWRVSRSAPMSRGRLNWELIRDYSAKALSAEHVADPSFYQYLHSLALAHLGEWTDANGIWAELRRSRIPRGILYEPRDPLLDEHGQRQRVQGVVREGGQRGFLHVETLHNDFVLSRRSNWPRDGEIAHAHITFSFGGPTAVRSDEV